MYTLGVLEEVEPLVGKLLCDEFGLIFGTSTGGIIAAMLGLGYSVANIKKEYFARIPRIMGARTAGGRSATLLREVRDLFGGRKFDEFKTGVGIVATHRGYRRPMVFKSLPAQAHGLTATFVPGFGCTIADAIAASAAAVPFFNSHKVHTANQGDPELLDGGFVANNPTLFAIADATNAMKVPLESLRVLSIGVGAYPEARQWWLKPVHGWWPFELLETTFGASSNTLETLRRLLFAGVAVVRIDDGFPDSKYATSLLETNSRKLQQLHGLGRESFAKRESDVRELLGL